MKTKGLHIANGYRSRPVDGQAILRVSYLYQRQVDYSSAVQSFLNARNSNKQQYEDEISWYLSLAYIKNGDLDKAEEELRRIVTKGNWKEMEAKELLQTLERK